MYVCKGELFTCQVSPFQPISNSVLAVRFNNPIIRSLLSSKQSTESSSEQPTPSSTPPASRSATPSLGLPETPPSGLSGPTTPRDLSGPLESTTPETVRPVSPEAAKVNRQQDFRATLQQRQNLLRLFQSSSKVPSKPKFADPLKLNSTASDPAQLASTLAQTDLSQDPVTAVIPARSTATQAQESPPIARADLCLPRVTPVLAEATTLERNTKANNNGNNIVGFTNEQFQQLLGALHHSHLTRASSVEFD